MTPYEQGRHDAERGCQPKDNPFLRRTDAHADWRRGWKAAHTDNDWNVNI